MRARRFAKYIIVNCQQEADKALMEELGAEYKEKYDNYQLPYRQEYVQRLLKYGASLDNQLLALVEPAPPDAWKHIVPKYVKSKRQQYPYQAEAVGILHYEKKNAFFHDMGTGKTKTATDSWTSLLDEGLIDYALILTMASLVNMWTDTLMPEDTDYEGVALNGSKADRIDKLRYGILHDKKAYVINYEGVATIINELVGAFKGKRIAVLLDESTSIKDVSTAKFKILWQFFEIIKPEYVGLYTGFPIDHSPEDILGQYAFIDYRLFGHPKTGKFTFRAQYVITHSVSKHMIVGYKNLDTFMRKLHLKAHRVTTADAGIHLPPQRFEALNLDLPKKLADVYKEFVKTNGVLRIPGHPRADEDGVVFRCEHPFTVYQKSAQIVNNFIYLETFESMEAEERARIEPVVLFPDLEMPKLAMAAELLESTDKPAVFVYVHHGMRKFIEEMLTKNHHSFITLDGGVPIQARNDLAQAFQKGRSRVLLLQESVGKMGFTLTRSDWMFFFERSSRVGNRAQILKRIHRIGSEIHDSILYHDALYNKTVDVSRYKQLMSGLELNTALMNKEELDKILNGSWIRPK